MIKNINNLIINILNRPELIFVIIAIIFGNIFLFLTPAGCVPDEHVHAYRSCEVAAGHFISRGHANDTNYDIKISNALSNKIKDENNNHSAATYSPVMYLSSAMGIKLGSIVSDDDLFIFRLGRLFNLLTYIILIAAAIKITPVYKYPFMFTGLLPMALFQAMSYSADSFTISFTFLMFAYTFKLLFSQNAPNKNQLTILTLFSYIGTFCKAAIYPIFLYIFLPLKKRKIFYLIYLFTTVFLLFYIVNLKLNSVYTNTNYDLIDDKLYIFHHPIETIKLFVRTTKFWGTFYIQSLIGYLGWISIQLPDYIYYRVIFIFFLMLFVLYEKISKQIKITAGITLIFLYLITLYIELITWTPVDGKIIQGVQGRYFIPFLPLLMLAFPAIKLNISEKYQNIFKLFVIFIIVNILYTVSWGINTYYWELGIKGFM